MPIRPSNTILLPIFPPCHDRPGLAFRRPRPPKSVPPYTSHPRRSRAHGLWAGARLRVIPADETLPARRRRGFRSPAPTGTARPATSRDAIHTTDIALAARRDGARASLCRRLKHLGDSPRRSARLSAPCCRRPPERGTPTSSLGKTRVAWSANTLAAACAGAATIDSRIELARHLRHSHEGGPCFGWPAGEAIGMAVPRRAPPRPA